MKKWVKITLAVVLAVFVTLGSLVYAATWSPKWMIAYAAINNSSSEVVKTSSNHVELSLSLPYPEAPNDSLIQFLDGLVIASDTSINYETKQALIEQHIQFKKMDMNGELQTYKPLFDALLDENHALHIRLKLDESAMYLQIPQSLLKNKEDTWIKFEKKDFESYDPTSGPELWDAIQKLVFNQSQPIKLDTIRDFSKDASDALLQSISGDYADVRSGDDSFRTVEFAVSSNQDVQQLTGELTFKALPAVIQLIQSNPEYRDFIISQIKESFSSQLDLLSTSSILNPGMNPEQPMEPNAMLYETFVTMKNDLEGKSSEAVDLTKKYTDAEVQQSFSEMLTQLNTKLVAPETKQDFDQTMTDMFNTVTFKNLSIGMDMSWTGEVTKQHMNVAVDIKDGDVITPFAMNVSMHNDYNQEMAFSLPAKSVNVSEIMTNYDSIFDVEKLAGAFLSFQGSTE